MFLFWSDSFMVGNEIDVLKDFEILRKESGRWT